MHTDSLNENLSELRRIAQQLGSFIVERLREDSSVTQSAGNGAYAIDLDAENQLRKLLAASSLEADLLLEDSVEPPQHDAHVLIADVLDGSANAVRRVPLYNVSLGLGKADLLRQYSPSLITASVIYSPTTHAMHFAGRGLGAFRNDDRIQPPSKSQIPLDAMVIGSIFSFSRAMEISEILASFRSVRLYGCATEHICGVARGDFDAYLAFHDRLRVVDVAGALLIAEEAGCVVCSLTGAPLSAAPEGRVSVLVARDQATAQAILRLVEVS